MTEINQPIHEPITKELDGTPFSLFMWLPFTEDGGGWNPFNASASIEVIFGKQARKVYANAAGPTSHGLTRGGVGGYGWTIGETYKFECEYYIPSTNTTVKEFQIINSMAGGYEKLYSYMPSGSTFESPTYDTWTKIGWVGVANAQTGIIYLRPSGGGNFVGANDVNDDWMAIANFKITHLP